MSLQLRDYQIETLDKLREGFMNGNRTQILYSPTGAGKTEMALALLEATSKKGNKSAMVLDRIILCDQTSQRLDRYKIDHGVMQAGHGRYRPYERVQICSAQTLEARGSFPAISLLVVDEAHALRKQTTAFIKNNPDVRVIGLSATPFTKGIGGVYSSVVSTVTTKQLVDQGILAPLRVFIAKEVDMTGVSKVAGEWNSAETEERSLKIVGDVVAEWIKKTHEIFGKPVKTIIFCSGVSHGTELANKFAEQGYNFVSISYRDDAQFKRDAIEDFAKPDTEIHGLIATDILTKGFDVPDVLIGVSARPFRKSLSSHIQQMGRVMRGAPGKEFAVWLDHSGNYLRFKEDWDQIYGEGVVTLDDSKESPKKEKTKKEKEAAKCPACGALWPANSDSCVHCGYVRQRKSKVESVSGTMEELEQSEMFKPTMQEKQLFWAMCQYKIKFSGWSRGRAAHLYKEKFGVWPNGLSDSLIKVPDVKFEKFITAGLIRYLNRRR